MPDISEQSDQQTFRKLYQSALALLARREHSVFELTQKLSQKIKKSHSQGARGSKCEGSDEQNSDEQDNDRQCDDEKLLSGVINKAIADGYLSDQRYAEAYTRSRMNKGFGSERIALELSQKGVDAELIATTLADAKESDVEQELISSTWNKKFSHSPRDFNEKMKQIRFLRYRGFSQEEIERFFAQLTGT